MKSPFETALHGIFRRLPACSRIPFFLSFFLLNIMLGWGQNPATEVPDYEWVDSEPLPTVTVNLISFSVNTEDVTIAIATDPNNFIYTLTFGSGIQKRNPDGSLEDDDFITGLKSPLDMAIDEDGYFYVADYSEETTCSENGKIRKYRPDGTFDRNIYTGFYRPLGIDVDTDGNIYVAEYNQEGNGCESDELSRVSVYNSSGNRIFQNNNVFRPYRLAVSKEKTVYLSQEGDGDPAVLTLDNNLNITGKLPDIQSPGSITIDHFGFIHVVEYAGRIDFSKFINFENLSITEIQDIAEEIDNGIDDEAYFIRIYDQEEVYRDSVTNKLDFPVDIAFNYCDKMFVDNLNAEGSYTFLGYVPEKLEFDLEIYNRTPSFDITPPEITCPADITVQADPGEDSKVVDYNMATATDLCGATVEVTEGPDPGDAFPVGTTDVVFTATDSSGNQSTCTLKVTVEPADEEPLTIVNCNYDTIELTADENCEYIMYDFTDDFAASDQDAEILQDPEPGILVSGEVTVTLTPVLDGVEGESCTFKVRSDDITPPEITSCPTNENIELEPGDAYIVPNYQSMIGISDNCDSNPVYSQSPLAGTEISETTTVNITVTDSSNNISDVCSFEIIVEKSEEFTIECKETYTVELGLNESVVSIPTEEFLEGDTSGMNFELNEQYFDCSNIGTFPLTINVEDQETGKTASCTVEVTVLDKGKPLLICQATTLQYSFSSGGTFEVPNLYENRISDNCDDLEDLVIVQDPPVGTDWDEPGTYKVTYSATDTYNNFSECTVTIELTEEQGPFITCPEEGDIPPIILDDDCDFEEPEFTSLVGTGNFENSPTFTQNLQRVDNTLEVEIEVFDGQDYIDSCSFTVDIIDTTDPIIACPDNISVEIPSEENSAIITYSTPQVQDNCDSNPQIELIDGYETGEPFPLGSTTVRWRVTDGSGNESDCSFNVFVSREDNPTNTPPEAEDDSYTVDQDDVLDEPAPGVLENDKDAENDPLSAILVNGPQHGTVTLNLDGSFEYIPNTGYWGPDSFTYIANDGSGDSNEATVVIDVISSSSDFTCRESPITLQLDQAGNASLELDDLYSGDASGLNLAASQLDFTCADLGENTIELSWTGQSSDSCEIKVIVEDNIDPVVDVDIIDVTLNSNGIAEITPTDLDAGSYDNCGELEFSLSKTRFTCEDTGQNSVVFTVTDDSGNSSTVNTIVFVNANPGTCNEPPRDNDYVFLYPNPTDGRVKISTPQDVSIDRVFVFDKRGRLIFSKDFDKSDLEYELFIDGVQNSVYTLQILTNEGEIIRRLIIRN